MENQIIKVDNLQVGDEIIYASNGSLRRIKIIRPLKLATKRQWGGKYSSTKVELMNVYDLDDNKVIRTVYQDLNYKDLWLLERTTI
tara:strand:+ start:246 stop:503 length:258 start_codon:yes stop_codon:yes gene_type:complete